MKKFLILVLSLICLIGCNFNNSNTSLIKEQKPSQEFINYMSQYHIIDSTDIVLEKLNIKIFQTLSEHEGLARLCSNKNYELYYGNIIYIMYDNILYDNKIIKDNFYFIGTYSYTRRDSLEATVPLYINENEYNNGHRRINFIRDFNKKWN